MLQCCVPVLQRLLGAISHGMHTAERRLEHWRCAYLGHWMNRLEYYTDDELDAQAYAAIEQHIERARYPEQYVEASTPWREHEAPHAPLRKPLSAQSGSR